VISPFFPSTVALRKNVGLVGDINPASTRSV
jgi:hypothetical protein